jgi:hypothetical protein
VKAKIQTPRAKNEVAPLSAELLKQFVDLATALSPEWLTCDGELSRREVNRRYAKLQRQWRALERKAGRAVMGDEVWAWDDAQRQPREVPPDAHLEQDYELRVSGDWEVDE